MRSHCIIVLPNCPGVTIEKKNSFEYYLKKKTNIHRGKWPQHDTWTLSGWHSGLDQGEGWNTYAAISFRPKSFNVAAQEEDTVPWDTYRWNWAKMRFRTVIEPFSIKSPAISKKTKPCFSPQQHSPLHNTVCMPDISYGLHCSPIPKSHIAPCPYYPLHTIFPNYLVLTCCFYPVSLWGSMLTQVEPGMLTVTFVLIKGKYQYKI